MSRPFFRLLFLIIISFSAASACGQPGRQYNLKFNSLASRWDDGIPLGNGWLGELIWQKGNNVRLSLDRVDLWDDRPMPGIGQLRFAWVVQQVNRGQYDTVQKLGDDPYDAYPAPTKIPGAALTFNCTSFGKVLSSELDIHTAISTVQFENGVSLINYVHAVEKRGYFAFKNLPSRKGGLDPEAFLPELIIPPYHRVNLEKDDNSHSGGGLQTLGYPEGTLVRTAGSIRYHQPTWNGNYYEVLVRWKKVGETEILGSWTISINSPASLPELKLFHTQLPGMGSHISWWDRFWKQSSVSLPDSLLQRQYLLEIYKMGCVARNHTPPISLQAIWTADNGNLPPWKGDIHNDLNTELSYWPFYTSNHLEEAKSFTNWLWQTRTENERWTKSYFGTDGLNVPGVTTLTGKAMGGWIQYSMSPTTVAWLCQYFYKQWEYGRDRQFLLERCKPYFDAAHLYFTEILREDPVTHRYRLPLSSSPEIYDNSIRAWFTVWTNYDLSLVLSFYREYSEVLQAVSGKIPADIEKERRLLPDLDTDSTGLTIAPGHDYFESHRHLSPYMAVYPLNLLTMDNPADQKIIKNSLDHIERKGTRAWCGYSFSWMACLYARAGEGDGARQMLRIFADNFCSVNSFHLNGDQKGGQYSGFTYRPFTLEGNFAFAQGIQEMLLQSDQGIIEIFPAIPAAWKKVSFTKLRAAGAFLISASRQGGSLQSVKVFSEKGGWVRLKWRPGTFHFSDPAKKYRFTGGILEFGMHPGEEITIQAG